MEDQIDLWIQGTFFGEEDKVYLLRKDGRFRRRWAVDDRLKSLDQESLKPLRKLQEKRFLANPASRMRNLQRKRKTFSFQEIPLVPIHHKGLLAYARKELQAEWATYSAFGK